MPIVPEGLPGSAMFPDSVTFEISAELGARRLSWVSMLICTNDGFTGLDSIKLPAHVGDEVTALTAGYDAGTEINTEDFADIVPPCQALVGVSSGEPGTGTSDPALAEGGVIHHHEGMLGEQTSCPRYTGGTSISQWPRWSSSASPDGSRWCGGLGPLECAGHIPDFTDTLRNTSPIDRLVSERQRVGERRSDRPT